MDRKHLIAATLAAAALAGGRPAAAEPTFFEPYGELFGARTILGSSSDSRPKDAIQGQKGVVEEPKTRLQVSPFFRSLETGGGSTDVFFAGTGLTFASARNPKNPWQVQVGAYNTNVQVDAAGFDKNFFGFEGAGKFVVWQPEAVNAPVVSIVGRWQDINRTGSRGDVLLAADQRLSSSLYLTGNVGWGRRAPEVGPDQDDLVAGAGATWAASPQLSFSADYVLKNDVDFGEDFWGVSASYAPEKKAWSARVGGGKHKTFFANLNWSWDR